MVVTPTAPHPPAAGTHPPLGPVRRTVREVGLALITAGVVILLFVAYQLFGTNITEANNQAALQRSFASQLRAHAPGPSTTPTTAPQGAPARGGGDAPTVGAAPAVSAPPGGAIDHLVIPRIGVNQYLVEGTGEASLSRGPGHYAGTAYPGQKGNAGIAGHRTTYGAPFYRLNELAVGDDIYFTDTTGARFRYQVDQAPFVVAPDDVAVLDPTPAATLTLTTCNPRFSATSRLIVKARLVGLPAPVTATGPPARTPATVPAAAPAPAPPLTLTGGNRSAWPPALLYGAAVVLLWVATRLVVNRTRRWARAGALAGGIALCCVPLWLCFENVVRLLPQSI